MKAGGDWGTFGIRPIVVLPSKLIVEELSDGTYNLIGSPELDFEEIFATAQPHPNQAASGNTDVGIAEDGSIVDLSLWYYEYTEEYEGYMLGKIVGSTFQVRLFGSS